MNVRKLYLVIVALLVVPLVLSACARANAGRTDPGALNHSGSDRSGISGSRCRAAVHAPQCEECLHAWFSQPRRQTRAQLLAEHCGA